MSAPFPHQTSHSLAKGGLVALAVVLGALNWYVAQDQPDISPIFPSEPQQAAAGDVKSVATAVPLIEVAAFEETLFRPLFEATRRPPQATAAAAETPTGEPAPDAALASQTDAPMADIETVKLLGVVLDGDTPARALLRWEGAAEADWVEAGSVINGWQLVSIASDRVILEVDGQQHEIRLFDYR